MGGFYILIGSILEKCGKYWKNGCFSGRIWPDWGNATRADLAGLGSIELSKDTKPGLVFMKSNGLFNYSDEIMWTFLSF